jgi:hypothetical protein
MRETWTIQPQPFLMELVKTYQTQHPEANRTEALHAILQQQAKDIETFKEYTKQLEQRLRIPQPRAGLPTKDEREQALAEPLVHCEYMKPPKDISQRYCDTCSTFPQTPEVPCPKRRRTPA